MVVLVVLIVAHEFGHFVLARRAGVTVHEFGIGFPPRIATIGHLWGTPITLNAIPLGGFVKLEGENSAAAHESRRRWRDREHRGAAAGRPAQLAEQSLPTRLAILLAGVG